MGHLNHISKQIVMLYEVGSILHKEWGKHFIHYGSAMLISDLVLELTGDLELL